MFKTAEVINGKGNGAFFFASPTFCETLFATFDKKTRFFCSRHTQSPHEIKIKQQLFLAYTNWPPYPAYRPTKVVGDEACG